MENCLGISLDSMGGGLPPTFLGSSKGYVLPSAPQESIPVAVTFLPSEFSSL